MYVLEVAGESRLGVSHVKLNHVEASQVTQSIHSGGMIESATPRDRKRFDVHKGEI